MNYSSLEFNPTKVWAAEESGDRSCPATLWLLQLSNGMLGCTDTAVTFVSPCRQLNIQEKHYLQKPVLIPLQLTKLFIPKPTLLHNVTCNLFNNCHPTGVFVILESPSGMLKAYLRSEKINAEYRQRRTRGMTRKIENLTKGAKDDICPAKF